MLNKVSFSLIVALAFATCAVGQDLEGVKCIVNGKAQAKAEASVDYIGAKVYFCCNNCVGKFKAAMEEEENKFATKANHQLVLTGQYVQKACPISGGELSDDASAKVGGVKVGFCCENCQAKVEKAEGLPAKAELVFSKAAFKKGFEAKKAEINLDGVMCMLMPKKAVKEKFFAEYGGGKVFFCCGGCKKKFESNPETYAAKANQQLVATGQIQQVSCPISGGDVDQSVTSEVAGVKVAFCCGNCKSKVDDAKDDKKVDLVFGEKGFKKGFGGE